MKKLFLTSLAGAFIALSALMSCSSDDTADPKKQEMEKRISSIIPADLLNKVKLHITIYDGTTPPNIEGTFLLDPMIGVYDSNGNDISGMNFGGYALKFTNQNTSINTFDYEDKQNGMVLQSGKGVISGSGNNFTVYIETKGRNNGINTTSAIIYTGTKTAEGIRNLKHVLVLVSKDDDPEHKLVDVGTCRIYKDGDDLCEPVNWEDY